MLGVQLLNFSPSPVESLLFNYMLTSAETLNLFITAAYNGSYLPVVNTSMKLFQNPIKCTG